MELIHKLLWMLTPEGITWLIQIGGIPAICLVIFAETGFFALLPGDSLLVLCGIFAATIGENGEPLLPIWTLLLLVPCCGIIGDQIGYWIGTFFGRAMYSWQDRSICGLPLFKTAWLRKTEEFYGRWGTFFIVAGRWVPFVRTFAPMVAGVIRMRFRVFITYNIIGAFTWVWSMLLVGYFLGGWVRTTFGFPLERHIDKIALVVVGLSLLPIIHTFIKERRLAKGTGQ
ncbi:MAG TPA: VTT domain-containing protein [bacterium]|nr:VTT domain-containing protein [bacterium]